MNIVTVGTFDGVHRGHKEVLSVLKEEACKKHLHPVAVTFDRHPLATIAPERAPELVMSPDDRDRLLESEGIRVLRLPFDESLRRMTVREWLETLRDKYHAGEIVLGYDNTFGSDGRNMSFDEYSRIARELGLEIIVAPQVEGCSSTAVRKAVKKGDMAEAEAILGRPFFITGKVTCGRQIGRTIGFPTANVSVDNHQLVPARGVYAALVETDGREYRSVVNVGNAPTVAGADPLRIEAHLIGFDGDLYGRHIKIEFLRRIRDEKKFDSLEALKLQIAEDISQVK